MAERYGVIPKKFTREWFDYVWTYYKWHIIIPIGVVIFAAVTLYQCTHRVQYDCNIYYAGEKVFTEKQVQGIESAMAEHIDDINDDGERLFDFQQINFNNEKGTEEMDYNLQMKLDLQLQTRSSHLYLFDKTEVDLMLARESVDLVYEPVDGWAMAMPSEDKLYTVDGTAYAVYVGGCERMKALGINTDDLYLVLCRHNDGKASDAEYANYVKLANYLIGTE